MRYLFVLLLLVGCSFTYGGNCDDVDGLKVNDFDLIPDNYTGVAIRCEDARLQALATYKNGNLDGVKRVLYIHGQLESEANYKDGELDGVYREWYVNGQLKNEANWKDGKWDGVRRWWWENGQLEFEETYKDGYILNDKVVCYNEDGAIYKTLYCEGGKIVAREGDCVFNCRLPYQYNKFIDYENNPKTEVYLVDDNKWYLIRDSIDLMVSNNKLRFYFLNYDKNKSGCGEELLIVMNNHCKEVFKSTISKENKFNLSGNIDSEIFQFNLQNVTKSILCLGFSGCGSAWNYSYYDIFYDNEKIIFNEIISSTTGWSQVNFLDKKNIYLKLEQAETYDDEGNIKNCHYDCPSKIKVSAFRLSDNQFLGEYLSVKEHMNLTIEDEIEYKEWLVELML